jgi:hypothetical protein
MFAAETAKGSKLCDTHKYIIHRLPLDCVLDGPPMNEGKVNILIIWTYNLQWFLKLVFIHLFPCVYPLHTFKDKRISQKLISTTFYAGPPHLCKGKVVPVLNLLSTTQ